MGSLKSKPPAIIRGVSAILGDDTELSSQEVSLNSIDIPLAQPRKYFDPEKMDQLIASIKAKGILEPILVRPKQEGRYELVAGERRYRAAQALSLGTIPVAVKELSDTEVLEVALIENLQREDLNPIEEVEGILQLLSIKLDATENEVISLLNRMVNEQQGKVTSNVTGNEQIKNILESLGVTNWLSFSTNKLPLLNLPSNVLDVLRDGKLEYTKAKAISKLKNEDQRQRLLDKSISEKLSLSQIREEVLSQKSGMKTADSIQSKITETFKLARKSKLTTAKQKQLEKYLDQIRKLLEL